jgi:hypothetical protein
MLGRDEAAERLFVFAKELEARAAELEAVPERSL